MRLPMLQSGRIMRIRFVSEIWLICVVVFYVHKIAETNHAFVMLVNGPIVLGKSHLSYFRIRIPQYRNEALTLNSFWLLDSR